MWGLECTQLQFGLRVMWQFSGLFVVCIDSMGWPADSAPCENHQGEG